MLNNVRSAGNSVGALDEPERKLGEAPSQKERIRMLPGLKWWHRLHRKIPLRSFFMLSKRKCLNSFETRLLTGAI